MTGIKSQVGRGVGRLVRRFLGPRECRLVVCESDVFITASLC